MTKKYPWLSLGKKTAPEIPFESPVWLGNHSNGEYFHQQTPFEAKMRQEILRRGDEAARRQGMDRRAFMASSMGMAVAMTDTPGQRPLAIDLGRAAALVPANDVDALATALARWANDPAELDCAKRTAWHAATRRWHWEHESERGVLSALVRGALA